MTRSLVLSLCAVLFFTVAAGWMLLGGRMSARTAEGARQSAPVIYIRTPEELRAIGDSRESLNGRYVLACDIVLCGAWKPIGSRLRPFTGSFDGNGHVIYGLQLSGGRGAGLFGAAWGAEIRNVTLKKANLKTAARFPVVGYAADTKIKDCCINPTGACGMPDMAVAL